MTDHTTATTADALPAVGAWIPLDLIDAAPQVRTDDGLDDESLQELADSIRAHGLLQPPVLAERDDGRYTIIAGERRIRACRLLGLTTVPAIAGRPASPHHATMQQIAENVHRVDLSPRDTAAAVRRLFDALQDLGAVARQLGKSKPWVSKYLAISHPDFSYRARWLLEHNEVEDLEILHCINQLEKTGAPYPVVTDLIDRAKAGTLNRAEARAIVEEQKATSAALKKAKKAAKKPAEKQTDADRAALAAATETREKQDAENAARWPQLAHQAAAMNFDLGTCTSRCDSLTDAQRAALQSAVAPYFHQGREFAKENRTNTMHALAAAFARTHLDEWEMAAWIAGASSSRQIEVDAILHRAAIISRDAAALERRARESAAAAAAALASSGALDATD